jgi:hypothetical protein
MSTTYAQLSASPLSPSATETKSEPTRIAQPSKKFLWTGRFFSGFAVAFLILDLYFKFALPPEAQESARQLGWPMTAFFGLGIVEAVCLILYLIPRSSVLGAILWTGYLGGAIATHVRVGNPLFTHILFPVYVALFLWVGLWLRNARLREVLPFRKIPSQY